MPIHCVSRTTARSQMATGKEYSPLTCHISILLFYVLWNSHVLSHSLGGKKKKKRIGIQPSGSLYLNGHFFAWKTTGFKARVLYTSSICGVCHKCRSTNTTEDISWARDWFGFGNKMRQTRSMSSWNITVQIWWMSQKQKPQGAWRGPSMKSWPG